MSVRKISPVSLWCFSRTILPSSASFRYPSFLSSTPNSHYLIIVSCNALLEQASAWNLSTMLDPLAFNHPPLLSLQDPPFHASPLMFLHSNCRECTEVISYFCLVHLFQDGKCTGHDLQDSVFPTSLLSNPVFLPLPHIALFSAVRKNESASIKPKTGARH